MLLSLSLESFLNPLPHDAKNIAPHAHMSMELDCSRGRGGIITNTSSLSLHGGLACQSGLSLWQLTLPLMAFMDSSWAHKTRVDC